MSGASPRRPVALAMIAIVLAVAAIGCSSDSQPEPETTTAQPADAEAGEVDAEEIEPTETLRHLMAQTYFPSASRRGLVGEPREIFMTPAPGDRAKQILAELISGPTQDRLVRALPTGTMLRQVYVLADGTAYVDFSSDLRRGMIGGSSEEIFVVYAIVNSVAMNIPEIRRVGILVDGQPVETLSGHLDLRRPLPPNPSLIVEEIAPEIARSAPVPADVG